MAMLKSKGQLKEKKNRTEAEMTKRWTTEVLLVRSGEETLCRGEALHRSEDPLRSRKPGDQSLKVSATQQGSNLRRGVAKHPFPKQERE